MFITLKELSVLEEKEAILVELEKILKNYDPESEVVTFLSCTGQYGRYYLVNKDIYKNIEGEKGLVTRVENISLKKLQI